MVVRYGTSLILALLVALSAVVPATIVAAAQPGQDQVARSKVEGLINAISSMLENLRKLGIDVSKAESLLSEARNALNQGDLGRARELALQALIEAGSKAREVRPPTPVAAGVAMELETLKKLVQSLTDEEAKQKLLEELQKAEEALSRGSVNETVKIIKEVREELRKLLERAREAVVERARVEVEAKVRMRTERELGELIAKSLRNAKSLADIGRAFNTLRNAEVLMKKFNISMEDLDMNLTEICQHVMGYLRNELGEDLTEMEQHFRNVPPGLNVSINATIRFIDRLTDRLPEDLKDEATKLREALTDLMRSLGKVYRCETDLSDIRSKIEEVVNSVGSYVLALRGQPKLKPTEFAAAVQLYATARWALMTVDTLPKIIACPRPGSEVEFRGVVLDIREDGLVVAYGVLKTLPSGLAAPTPLGNLKLRPTVRIGIFALDLSQVGNLNISIGNLVVSLGRYQGYNEEIRMHVILVSKIWVAQLKDILAD